MTDLPVTVDRARLSSPVRRAFTLVELLVVIAIISLLAAMLLPAINLVRVSARTATCVSNQHQLSLGLIAWANDHESRLPPASIGNSIGWAAANPLPGLVGTLADNSLLSAGGYLPISAFACPESRRHRAEQAEWFRAMVGISYCYDYAANISFVGNGPDPTDDQAPYFSFIAMQPSRFPAPNAVPGRTVLTVDGVHFVSYTDYGAGVVRASGSHANGTRTVASYADGHVEVVPLTMLGSGAGWPTVAGFIPSYIAFPTGVEAPP